MDAVSNDSRVNNIITTFGFARINDDFSVSWH
jgi:hypothetical protein